MIKEYIVKKSIGNHSGRVFSQKEVGELVRCKDCKYFDCFDNDGKIGKCVILSQMMNINDFCSFGKRKDETN